MQNRGVLTWSGWVPCSRNEGGLIRRLAARRDHPTILHALELQARRANLRRGRAALGQQIERLTDAYLAGVVPMAEYQRRRRDTEARLQALDRQETELTHDAERQGETAGLAAHAEAFCSRVRDGLASAGFDQKRALLELLVDRVVVANGAVEIRYVVPTGPEGEREPFCRLRSDYLETAMFRYKHLIGPKLHGRSLPGQQGEAAIAVSVLNRMVRTAKPISVRVA